MATAKELKALSIARRLAAELDGISGVDIGFIYRERRMTREVGIRFHLARKRTPAEVPASQFVPKEILGIPCDVLGVKYAVQSGQRRREFTPLCPGISVGNVSHPSSGTLGAFVRDRATKSLGILSNWHVLVGHTSGGAGDPVSQPAPLPIRSTPNRVVATLVRSTELDHGLDAAFAVLADAFVQSIDETPFELDRRPIRVVEPRRGMKVLKSGLASGVSHGIVDGEAGSYLMDYTDYGDTTRSMDGIRIVPDPDEPLEEVSLAGDSGSVWVMRDSPDTAVALHFGGEDQLGMAAEYALAHPLATVLDRLDVELVAADAAPA